MNRIEFKIAAALCGMIALASCAEEVVNEEMPEPDSELCIATRGEASEIATPVNIYVFNSDNRCVRMETFTESTWRFSEKLPAGNYSVYAIGGADPTRLVLPTADNATKTTSLTLQSGASLGDLMTANSTVTLVANGQNSLTLSMQRKVMQIEQITIKDVPADITSVSVSITHTYENILLNGEYTGETGSFTCNLTKQDNGDWVYNTSNTFLLPSVGNPTIAVTMGSTTYSYNSTEPLEANHKLSIEGTFCDNMFNLSGTVTGVSWGDNKSINFQFNSDGTSQGNTNTEPNSGNEGGGGTSANIPEVGTLYQDTYFVLAVNGNDVTLLSNKETTGIVTKNISQSDANNNITSKLNMWNDGESTWKWELPNRENAIYIFNHQELINSLVSESIKKTIYSSTSSYLFKDNNSIKVFYPNMDKFDPAAIFQEDTYLRPVTTITIN